MTDWQLLYETLLRDYSKNRAALDLLKTKYPTIYKEITNDHNR